MADVQKYFLQFHNAIKLSYNDSALLREKRDIVLRDLRTGLRRIFSTRAPAFKYFNQGSYAIGTGVIPIDGDHDIDVGVVFELDKDGYSPVEVKDWVYNALYTRNRTVDFLRPCVRVQYHQADFKAYHIDIAVYVKETQARTNKTTYYISKGFQRSKEDLKLWEVSEPLELVNIIKRKFRDPDDARQFRRVIRYLKRWNDLNFHSGGHSKPRGIMYTALAYRMFRPNRTYDWSKEVYCYNDLKACRNFVSSIIGGFNWFSEISITLPVKPNNNLFEKMTKKQMATFREKLLVFKRSLDLAVKSRSIENTCGILYEVFGDDFPSVD